MTHLSARFAPVSSRVRANLKPVSAFAIAARLAIFRSAPLAMFITLLAVCAGMASAQTAAPGSGGAVVTQPASSVPNAADAGVRVRTNLEVLAQFRAQPQIAPQGATATTIKPIYNGPPFPGLFYETPASLACIYDLQPSSPGCNPNTAFLNPNGGRNAMAIVDAYDDPDAYTDLANFSGQFGLPAINPTSFVVVFAPTGGATPGSCVGAATRPASAAGTGWDIEESLDIEYAHGMAPLATLYLVEAQSPSYADMNCAVAIAGGLVAAAGGGEVSMSWGSGEFSGETAFDAIFTTPKVVYVASAGDGPGVLYPSASPNVVAAGGSTLSTNATTGAFISENVWQETGGGLSAFEPMPFFQSGISALASSGYRGTPDVSSDANPYTGVWVLDSLTYGFPVWFIVGGTSLSAPTWAGIINSAGSFAASSKAELTKLYGDKGKDFNEVAIGSCGIYMENLASSSWNFCSGLGSPKGYTGK
jgi:kumamolisin